MLKKIVMVKGISLLYNVHGESYSSNDIEKRHDYPHLPLDHDKTPSKILHNLLHYIDIPDCFCQDAKSHIFQKLFLNSLT